MSWSREEKYRSDELDEECESEKASHIARLLLEGKSSEYLCMLCLCGKSLLGAEDSVYLGNEHIDTTISVKTILDRLRIIPTKYESQKGMFEKVCATCVNQLSQFYMFIFKCQKSIHAFKEFELLVLHDTEAFQNKLPAKIEIPSDNIYDYGVDYEFVGLLDTTPDEDVKFDVKIEPLEIAPMHVQIQKREHEMLNSGVQGTAANGLTQSCSISDVQFETADELAQHRKHHQYSNVINHISQRAPLCICCLKTDQNLRCLSDKIIINEMLNDCGDLSKYEETPAKLIKNVFNITIGETTDFILICDMCIDHVMKAFRFYNVLKESLTCVKALTRIFEESMNKIIYNSNKLHHGYICIDFEKLVPAKLKSGSRKKNENHKCDKAISFKGHIVRKHAAIKQLNVEDLRPFGVSLIQKQTKIKRTLNKCPICHEVSRTYSHLKTHTAKELKEFDIQIITADKIKCDHCGKILSKMGINRHIREAHCGKKVKKKKKRELPAKRFQCDQCDYKIDNRIDLEGHINKRHLHMRPYSCDICGECFHNKKLHIRHVKRRHATSELCPQCGKCFGSKIGLDRHIRLHAGEKRFRKRTHKCDRCDFNTCQRDLLEGHMNRYHLKVRPYLCEICSKRFYTKKLCAAHERRHGTVKSEMCPHCGKRLSSQRSLKSHIAEQHNGENPPQKYRLECDHCGYKTQTKAALEGHINKHHLNQRPYPCDICGKSFYTKYKCAEHVQTHVLSKPEMCTRCGKRFGSKKALIFHTRLHTGERPYKCQKCNDSYVNISRLQHHIRSKHSAKDTPCPICSKLFHSVLLRNHIRKAHAERENVFKKEQGI